MPFSIYLLKQQKTKQWTFEISKEAAELQELLNNGNRIGYVARLKELSSAGHKFSRTKGIVYEIFDKGETIDVSIKFQVKGRVITWAFISPMDKTHQSFRDLVFNTAAKAHACVKNSCETYYRGTNHFHLKVMHTHEGESLFNHNHYRTADDGPITPVEVYEHLVGFYAQKEGKQFISSQDERDDIILKYSLYWAEYNADINYVGLSFMEGEGGITRVISQLEDIARVGKLTPDQADQKLEEFFASEHGKNIFQLAENRGILRENLSELKEALKDSYREIYAEIFPNIGVNRTVDESMEPQKAASESSSSSSSGRSSPRDNYETAPDQTLDKIDQLEFDAFAFDLTKHCQSIRKEYLEELNLEDFRKGLTLYHALRTAQEESQFTPEKGQRFHKDFDVNLSIMQMIKELPALQHGSTEDTLGEPLLNKLIEWVKNAPPALDDWVEWVKKNGSRGLGSEIALVREASGSVDLRQAVPQDDRKPTDELAEINFDNVNLEKIFLPNKEMNETVLKYKALLAKEMQRLVNQQIANPASDKSVYKAKIKIISLALSVLGGNTPPSKLKEELESSEEWVSVPNGRIQSRLSELIVDVINLSTLSVSELSGSKPRN